MLLYAVNDDAAVHAPARRWLDGALNGERAVGFAWIALLAFLRPSTAPGCSPRPLGVARATETVDLWLAQPPSVVRNPTPRHPSLLRGLLDGLGSGGNLVDDAHLAALAVEHGAEIVSFDADFARFPGVRWTSPA